MSQRRELTIIGGGLVGLAAAIELGQQGYQSRVLERGPNPLEHVRARGRSVHLVLSARGKQCLHQLGILESVLALGLPLVGRQFHGHDGAVQLSNYARDGAAIHCIERGALHRALVDCALAAGRGIDIQWDSQVEHVDPDTGAVSGQDGSGAAFHLQSERILITDGAFSRLRSQLAAADKSLTLSHDWLDLGYKEVGISKAAALSLGLQADRFQVWTQNSCFFGAFPNRDGSFTGSLFLSRTGFPSFDSLGSESDFLHFTRTHFPSLSPVAEELWPQVRDNPVSGLCRVKCNPWTWSGRVLMLGDAAHAVVPFLGQGMNSGLEDVQLFSQVLADSNHRWPEAIQTFDRTRRPDADAVDQLSLDNYAHINHRPDPLDPLREQISDRLYQLAPWWFQPVYEAVAFNTQPYSAVLRLERLREQVVEGLLGHPLFKAGWPDDTAQADTEILAVINHPEFRAGVIRAH